MNTATTTAEVPRGGDMILCSACGASRHVTAPMCPKCGASQRRRGYKSKVAAGLLALFLGGFGIHRFYLGQWWGVFYLLFFWLWIPALVALVEGIVFLLRDQEKWDARHNEGKPNLGGESSAALVLVLVFAAFGGVAVIGILAAIAIPAYQDYTVRARIQSAISEARQAQSAVERFVVERREFPASNTEAGISAGIGGASARSVDVVDGLIVLTLGEGLGRASGATIVFRPSVEDQGFKWSCTEGSLEPRFRPPRCR